MRSHTSPRRLACAAAALLLLPAQEPLPAQSSAARRAPPATRFGDARLATGVRLHYAERGDATGTPVILLHGYSDGWYSWNLVLPLFPASLRVYALDQRGHGDSERPASGYTLPELAADVIAFMDAKGIRRATIVGHSMGSIVAQHVAAAAPERVARLVLVSSATTLRAFDGMSELRQAVLSAGDTVPTAFAREFQLSTAHRPVPPAFMDRMVAGSARMPGRVWRALSDGFEADTLPVARGGHRIPTLILWGERDPYATRREQDALLRLLPQAKLLVYENTGHAAMWERPADFARDVAAFAAGGGTANAVTTSTAYRRKSPAGSRSVPFQGRR